RSTWLLPNSRPRWKASGAGRWFRTLSKSWYMGWRRRPSKWKKPTMKITTLKLMKLIAGLALSGAVATTCFAGEGQKWEEVPEAVRATILANGGVAGQSVDLEKGKKNGKAVYEAAVKDKDGNVSDLVVTEDGRLINTKHDDAMDTAQELADRAKKTMKFSHPRDITNPYLPLATLKQDTLEGTEGGKKVHIERTVMPDKHKTFTLGKQTIEALVVE